MTLLIDVHVIDPFFQNHSKETTLSAIQLALEILANVCYVEGTLDGYVRVFQCVCMTEKE